MPTAVNPNAVVRVLTPRIGRDSAIAAAEEAAGVLSSYSSFRGSLTELEERLQRAIFAALYRSLGPRLETAKEDGTPMRIHLDDLPTLSDDALYALFDAWPISASAYTALRAYGLENGSTSAMRVLYCKYPDHFDTGDLKLMERIFRETLLPEQRKGWLD